MAVLTFPPLSNDPTLIHGFSLRRPEHPHASGPEAVLPLFGIDSGQIVQAEQPHGNRPACVDSSHAGKIVTGVDALITATPGLVLVIRTADCAPVFIWDPARKVIALIHSGKKGTAANIAGATVRELCAHHGSSPKDLRAVIGPCIRPPDYEVDIAAGILAQLKECGLPDCFDCGENTASDLQRFYSFRKEKGQTGRHFAYLSLKA